MIKMIIVWEVALASYADSLWLSIFPFFTEPSGYSFSAIFESQEILDGLVGAWWFLGLFVVFGLFNSVLGEEFLFRGVLLPKMEGVFGRWDWVANGILFELKHVYQRWTWGPAYFMALPLPCWVDPLAVCGCRGCCIGRAVGSLA